MLDNNELFKKWTKSVMILATIFAIWIFLGEVIAFIYLKFGQSSNIGLFQYFLEHMLLPTMINGLIILVGYKLIHIKNISTQRKSIIPLTVFILVSCCYIVFHHSSPICILSLSLPILLSVLYSDRNITKMMTFICSLFAIIISLILLKFNYHLGYEYIINLVTTLIFLLGLTFTAFSMIKLVMEKNKLLIAAINERNLFHEQSIIDKLTKCYNRAYYIDKINNSLKKQGQLLLAIIDIDHFKKVNDTYGHSAGDEILKHLGKTLNRINSDEIFVARYGGEEFVILFSNYKLEQANRIIEKLRDKISSKQFKELNGNTITFSCGLAERTKNDTSNTLFDRADKALYEAKNTGRNKTIIYNK